MDTSPTPYSRGLTAGEVQRIVNRWIGVDAGYLGEFTYASHAAFYAEYCDLDIDPYEFEGTTREKFIRVLSHSPQRIRLGLSEV